jgi:hypothetical protein
MSTSGKNVKLLLLFYRSTKKNKANPPNFEKPDETAKMTNVHTFYNMQVYMQDFFAANVWYLMEYIVPPSIIIIHNFSKNRPSITVACIIRQVSE